MERENGKRYAGLDVLRILFCYGIVIYHINDVFQSAPSRYFPFLCRYGGYLGNYFFFMASGFLMACRQKDRISEEHLPHFLWARLRKIYPMYLLSTLSILILGGTEITVGRILSSVFLVSTGWLDGDTMPLNFPAWFLCILVICELWYFAIGKLSARFPRLYLPLCGFFAVWGAALQIMNWEIPLNYRTCGEGYLNFFLGVLLAELFVKVSFPRRGHLVTGGSALLAALLLGGSLVCADRAPAAVPWLISPFCAFLLYAAVRLRLPALPAWIPPDLPGQFTMLIFLWHIPLVWDFLFLQTKSPLAGIPPEWSFPLYLLILSVFMLIFCIGSRDS